MNAHWDNPLEGFARGPAGNDCIAGPVAPVFRFTLVVAGQVCTIDLGAGVLNAKSGTSIVRVW